MATAASRRSPPALADAARAHAYARATARLLASGRVFAACSGCVAIVASLVLALDPIAAREPSFRHWALWSLVISSLPAAWYAWRVRLDEGLFADLARSIAIQPSSNAALADLDGALAALGLATVNDNALRSLASRGIGARGLVIIQGAIACGQILALVALLYPGRG